MAETQLYPAKQRSSIWLALFFSALLHGAAVAVAEIHPEPIPLAPAPADQGATVELESPTTSQEPTPPPVFPEETPPPALPDTTDFPESAPVPTPRPVPHNSNPIERAPGFRTGPASPSARALALSAPRPEYPYEARRGRITGEGVALLLIERTSGRVLEVTMSKSTGSAVLDQATIAGFRRWRFKAGSASVVRCPITYTLTGAQF